MSRESRIGGLHVVADGTGPPVLLTPGLGLCWFDWDRVVPLLAPTHLVLRFDRPGLGQSLPAGVPTLRGEADRIAGIIRTLGLDRPVVVAHSVAGFHAEACARLHPDLVGALVLVDPSCVEEARTAHPRLAGLVARGGFAAARLPGAARLAGWVGPPARRRMVAAESKLGTDPAPPQLVRESYGTSAALAAALAEYATFATMAAELRALRRELPLPDVALTVLSAMGDVPERRRAFYRRCQGSLTDLVRHGSVVELPHSAHLVQLDQPDAIADAVRGVEP